MKHITQILIDNGFKTFRVVYKDKKFTYVPCEFKNEYSSMINGGLDYRFIRDDIEVCYGLNEANKPPTLIHPRPRGIQNDDQMNDALRGDNYKIFKEIV